MGGQQEVDRVRVLACSPRAAFHSLAWAPAPPDPGHPWSHMQGPKGHLWVGAYGYTCALVSAVLVNLCVCRCVYA